MRLQKKLYADLRGQYRMVVQIGVILALLVTIVAVRIDWSPDNKFEIPAVVQTLVQIEQIEQTEQMRKPPPPPSRPMPIEIPNDQVLDEAIIDLDAEIDFRAVLDVPPPPSPPPAPESEEGKEEFEIFVIVEEMPELIGGLQSLRDCIQYPELARKAGVEGTVFVQFVVDEQGDISDLHVVRSSAHSLEAEALRCVSLVRFTPGRQRGKAVKVQVSLPVRFVLRSMN